MLKIVTFFYKLCNRLSIRFGKAAFELKTIKYHLEFGERDDDIYVVTYPKSGTTLMQMMLYQLTTDGKIDFKHIYDVSPWTDNDVFRDIAPREFKMMKRFQIFIKKFTSKYVDEIETTDIFFSCEFTWIAFSMISHR